MSTTVTLNTPVLACRPRESVTFTVTFTDRSDDGASKFMRGAPVFTRSTQFCMPVHAPPVLFTTSKYDILPSLDMDTTVTVRAVLFPKSGSSTIMNDPFEYGVTSAGYVDSSSTR